MNRQKAVSLLLLLTELAVTLFIAGIVVPSLIRSDLATNEALATGSLHAIKIAGITFSYTTKNIVFAILGAPVGAMLAFAIHSLNLFIVGFAAPEETRREIADWLKAQYPGVKILALNRGALMVVKS